MRRFSALLPIFLAACGGLPPQLSLVTNAADGVSYVLTGKTSIGHLFASLTKPDCREIPEARRQGACKAKQGDSAIHALRQVEGGYPGAAIDRPLKSNETVALAFVESPQNTAQSTPGPVLAETARTPPAPVLETPVVEAAALAAPPRRLPPASQSVPIPSMDAIIAASETPPEGQIIAPVDPVALGLSLEGVAPPDAPRKPPENHSYYVVVGTYQNWVTALETAGHQSLGVVSVVTAREQGAKKHRVLIGPLDTESARDTQRHLKGGGFQNAWLVRPCGGDTAKAKSLEAGNEACMDLRTVWR